MGKECVLWLIPAFLDPTFPQRFKMHSLLGQEYTLLFTGEFIVSIYLLRTYDVIGDTAKKETYKNPCPHRHLHALWCRSTDTCGTLDSDKCWGGIIRQGTGIAGCRGRCLKFWYINREVPLKRCHLSKEMKKDGKEGSDDSEVGTTWHSHKTESWCLMKENIAMWIQWGNGRLDGMQYSTDFCKNWSFYIFTPVK